MKRLIILLLVFGYGAVFSQKITIGKDQCVHCSMVIRDGAFAAVAIDNESVQKFDAIECLVNFLKENKEGAFTELKVADYSKAGNWVDARSATYLKSPEIPSPMGAYLSAFADEPAAMRVQKETGGELMDWEAVKLRFKESRFGVLNHVDHHHNADAYAPMGIMGDHMHHRGSFMLSYRVMSMAMTENLEGRREADHMMLHMNYMMIPEKMTMIMHMVGAMYAPSDRITLMAMQSIIVKEMAMMHMMGADSRSTSSGISDLSLGALISLLRKQQTSLHLNSALSVPLGSINQSTQTSMSDNVRLPYPMQMGSGTVDMLAGFTFRHVVDKFGFGCQELNTIRTGKNPAGYQLGNEYKINTWGSFNIGSSVAVSARVEGVKLGMITGKDSELNPMMSPQSSSANSGCWRARTFIGTNFSFKSMTALENLRIGIEYGIPVYQYVNGIQMNEKRTLNAGLIYML